jgi:hypothetical protein
MSRNLRLARLDDRQKDTIAPAEYSPTYGDGVFMEPIDLITFPVEDELAFAVCGLTTAERFWAAFRPDRLPDLVVGDIDFEWDKSTPLQDWKADFQHIPTGLSHIKPLAALARAVGSPLAIAIHTGEPRKWKVFAEGGDDVPTDARVFGLLAAHEAIELAAILDDSIPWKGRNDLAPVWHWLETRTTANPETALELVLPIYRRKVVERLRRSAMGNDPLAIRVRAGDVARLRNWCQAMSSNPVPLRTVPPEIGLPLLYPDGRTDLINFASLFAEVYGILDEELPPACFELTPPADNDPIWELSDGLPRIGALVAILGGTDDAVAKARSALDLLPLDGQVTERENLNEIEQDPLARGFAVLFRVLQILRMDTLTWQRVWNTGPWDPTKCCETDEPFWIKADSLEHWIDLFNEALERAVDDGEYLDDDDSEDGPKFFDISQIIGTLKQMVSADGGPDLNELKEAQADKHLQILVEMQLAERRLPAAGGGTMYRHLEEGASLPPSAKPAYFTDWKLPSDTMLTNLTTSLGFPAADANSIGRVLYRAFLRVEGAGNPADAEMVRAGKQKILEPFIRGESSGWIVEICREFARKHLNWKDERTWPFALRRRS